MHSLFRAINVTFPTAIIFAVLILVVGGCQNAAEANRVDPKLARSTLESVLDSWKRGESIDSMQAQQPAIVVQDMDWKAGFKLRSFEILNDGEAADANLFCSVKLSLDDVGGKPVERHVTYIVGTAPVLTVFRSLTP